MSQKMAFSFKVVQGSAARGPKEYMLESTVDIPEPHEFTAIVSINSLVSVTGSGGSGSGAWTHTLEFKESGSDEEEGGSSHGGHDHGHAHHQKPAAVTGMLVTENRLMFCNIFISLFCVGWCTRVT